MKTNFILLHDDNLTHLLTYPSYKYCTTIQPTKDCNVEHNRQVHIESLGCVCFKY